MSMSLSFDAPVPRIQCAKESGADAGLMGITSYMIRPNGALHVLASVNNVAPLTDGNSFTPAKFSTDESPGLALMLTLIEGLGLR